MTVAPGTVTIFCRACLDNPRTITGNIDFGVVDALLFSSHIIDRTSIISSSLRFSKRETILDEGVYDITANVRILLNVRQNPDNLYTRKVTAFREIDGVDSYSSTNKPYKLMGDIVDVCTPFRFGVPPSTCLRISV